VIADELKSSGKVTSDKPTIWHLDFNPEVSNASIDSVNQVINITGKSTLTANLLYPSGMKMENKKVSWAGRQVNASVNSIFSTGNDQQILAVLAAHENTQKAPVSRLIKSDHLIGAVIDEETASKAVVFNLENNREGNFELVGRSKTTCYLFSCPPNAKYDVSISTKPSSNGLTIYTLQLKSGGKFQANENGTLVLTLGNAKTTTIRQEDGL
jgi:hypothetical protein